MTYTAEQYEKYLKKLREDYLSKQSPLDKKIQGNRQSLLAVKSSRGSIIQRKGRDLL